MNTQLQHMPSTNAQCASPSHSRGWTLLGFLPGLYTSKKGLSIILVRFSMFSALLCSLLFAPRGVWGQTTIWSDNFDGTSNWTVAGNFVVAAPGASNTVTSPRSGTKVLATVANGDYANGCSESTNNAVTTNSFSCVGFSNVYLQYYSYSRFEAGYDYGYVYYSIDGGSTWTLAESFSSNSEGAYTLHTVSFQNAGGASQVKMKFTMYSDGSNRRTGWNVDDLAVIGEYTVPATGNNSFSICSGNLYDNGGSQSNYAGNSNGYTVLNPSSAGNAVRISGTITSEGGYDYLTVYDGNTTSGTVLWGGSAHGSGTSCGTFAVPTLTSTTGPLTIKFYSDGSNNCSGFNLTVSCVALCTAPTITGTTPASRCGTGTVTLGATASAGTVNWYTASTGGTALATGTSYTTSSISTTTTYYVDATNAGCTTASRTAVTATVTNPIVTIAVAETSGTSNDGTLCASGASATLTASGATTYTWTPSTGLSATNTAAVTSTPSTTTTYTVTGTTSGCTGVATSTITVLNITTYYSKSSGNLDDVATWGSNTDGTGCSPSNFTTAGTTYVIQNNATPTTSASGWSVSGAGSIVKVGNGSSAITLTAGADLSFSCDLEITGNATLNLNNKNLTLSGDFVRSASTAGFNAGGTNSVVTFSGGANQFVNVIAVDTGNPATSDISFNDVTVTGTDVRMYYDNNNNKKVNIRNLSVSAAGVLKFFSNP